MFPSYSMVIPVLKSLVVIIIPPNNYIYYTTNICFCIVYYSSDSVKLFWVKINKLKNGEIHHKLYILIKL